MTFHSIPCHWMILQDEQLSCDNHCRMHMRLHSQIPISMFSNPISLLSSHFFGLDVASSCVAETPNSLWTVIPADYPIVSSVWLRDPKTHVYDADIGRRREWNNLYT